MNLLASAVVSGQPLDFAFFASLVAAGLFVMSLKWLSHPTTARQGVLAGEVGMGLAILAALLTVWNMPGNSGFGWILAGVLLGAAAGIPMAVWMPMTAVPQRTALSHAFGALAAMLVGIAHYYIHYWHIYKEAEGNHAHWLTMFFLCSEVLLGALTFTGSLMAFAKLQELMPTRPITYPHQNVINFALLGTALLVGLLLVLFPGQTWLFPIFVLLGLAFGVLLILPIGGADMPTVISLLNSYAGLSASMMGFVLNQPLLIVAGALDGSSGLILSIIMCKAMNRSFFNVLFGAFGQVQASAAQASQKQVKSLSTEEAAVLMSTAGTVVVVPGYGMAVAQAQHAVRELYQSLTSRGVDVKFAIHPVAGRMPGHMNVLLAEAEIPYDRLIEMDDINAEFPQVDVVLVIGANDVVNPAARHDKSSPIYGMPILDVDKVRTVLVIKRSMNPGFAGVENELFYLDHTSMLFGDAKGVVANLVKEMKEAG